MMKLNPDIVKIWRIKILIRAIFFIILSILFEIFLKDEIFGEDVIHGGVITSVFTLFQLFTLILIPKYNYKFWKFEIREDEIYIEKGIFTRIKTTAPFTRIQHLDVRYDLFDRMYDLSKLVIYTAGSRGADIIIPGLPLYYAEDLRDKLKDYTVEDAV